MKKFLISASLSVLAITSIAATWGESAAWVYVPKYSNYDPYPYCEWLVTDARGNAAALYYKNDMSGELDKESLKDALSTLKLSVASVFENMAYLAQDVVGMNSTMREMDLDLQDLSTKLDNVFATVFGKLKKLETTEESADSESTATTTREIVVRDEKTIVVGGGVESLKVDNKSISTVMSGGKKAYQLRGFDANSVANGLIPCTYNGVLSWCFPWGKGDDKSISIDTKYGMPDKSGNNHGFHLTGWYSPSIPPTRCDETLAENLKASTPDTSHYVLTRYDDGTDTNMHYMRIGNLGAIGGGGSATKIIGTTASNYRFIGAPASKTNTVTFASASDSNVAVTIGGAENAVTITIGVYYK